MSPMISLKLPKKKNTDNTPKIPESVEREQYPFGTLLRFETEQIEKITALQSVNAGDMVEVKAIAKVREVRVVDTDAPGKKRQTVEIQVQRIDISREPSEEFSESFDKATSGQ